MEQRGRKFQKINLVAGKGTAFRCFLKDGVLTIMSTKVDDKKFDYFLYIGEDEVSEAEKWVNQQKKGYIKNKTERDFLQSARKAIREFHEGSLEPFWINIVDPGRKEPELDDDTEEIQFKPGNPEFVGLSANQWESAYEKFAPERNSQVATKKQVFLYFAFLGSRGLSIDEITIDSSGIGNYGDNQNASRKLEYTGEREILGVYNGFGNVRMICWDDEKQCYLELGGYWFEGGEFNPIAKAEVVDDPDQSNMDSIAFCAITKGEEDDED